MVFFSRQQAGRVGHSFLNGICVGFNITFADRRGGCERGRTWAGGGGLEWPGDGIRRQDHGEARQDDDHYPNQFS